MTEEELLVDCLRRLEDSGIRYMLVGSMAGNYWEYEFERFQRRRRVTLFDQAAWITAPEDVLHKLHWCTSSPTDRQLTDARGIFLVSGDELDRDYMNFWAKQIGVSELLDNILGV